jgi:nucleoside 2-deoxyribosyltransferase
MIEKIEVGDICPITSLTIVALHERLPRAISHFVAFAGKSYLVQASSSFAEFLIKTPEMRKLVVGCLLNYPLSERIWLTKQEIPGMTDWNDWLNGLEYPRNDIDKIDFALKRIFKINGKMGAEIELDMEEKWNFVFFCQDKAELRFVFKTLTSKGLISFEEFKSGQGRVVPWKISLTYEGLIWLNQKDKEVQKDLCFVAMSFGPDETPIFNEALKPAIEAAGYQARRVDDTDHHIDKEQTINDSILALAKKANFVVCDYTGNKRGVYFEHGYAWGMGKKVIMTCKDPEVQKQEWVASGKDEKDFEPLHFDVRNYPFIMWTDLADLRTRLQAKIESWIGRFEK